MPSKLNTKEFQVVFPMIPGLATRKDDLLIDSHDLLFRLMFLMHEQSLRSPCTQETNVFGGTWVVWQPDLWLKLEVWDALVAPSGIESCKPLLPNQLKRPLFCRYLTYMISKIGCWSSWDSVPWTNEMGLSENSLAMISPKIIKNQDSLRMS